MDADKLSKPNRQTIRLQNYDYSQAGAYFVTICVEGMEHRLGEVVDGEMILYKVGKIAFDGFAWLLDTFEIAKIDVFCIMPNHVHAIVSIVEPGRGGETQPERDLATNAGRDTLPLRQSFGYMNPISPSIIKEPSLNQLIGYYKYSTTVAINNKRDTPGQKFWQRNFYERVIRNQREYDAIWEYIDGNAAKWEEDKYF